MRYVRIETNYGDVLIKQCYDIIECITFYDVYNIPDTEEELVGEYLGEFLTIYNLDEDTNLFKTDLDNWLKNL